jgi:protoporphyrinogen oxidase
LTNAFIKEFHHKDNQITGITVEIGKGSAQFSCDTLISSIALPQLLNYVLPEKQDADILSARHLLLVYLFVNKPKVIDEQWVFFPERKFIFSRISEQKNMSEDIAPDDKTIVCCDFTCEADSEIWSTNDDLLITRCAQQLAEAKIMNLADIQKDACFVIRKKNFYPRYDLQYLEKMAHVTSKLKKFTNLLTTGRLGMFNYNNSDHCFDMGKFIAQGLSDKKTCPQIWAELEERVREYKIVD